MKFVGIPQRSRSLTISLLVIIAALGTVFAASQAAAAPMSARIVNGTALTSTIYANEWPFLVALVDPSSTNNRDGQFCGGSLIAPDVVVTAAHCVDGSVPGDINIVAGTHFLSAAAPVGRIAVTSIIMHPAYNNNVSGFASDAAVLHLAANAPVSADIIDLAEEETPATWGGGAGRPLSSGGVWAAGWGGLYFGGPGAGTTAREVNVPLVSDNTCRKSPGANGYGTEFDYGVMICAGVLDTDGNPATTNGKDTCQGDSGGPLVSYTAGVPTLVGLTSWGSGCASTQYGVYARVPELKKWIMQEADTPCTVAPDAATGGVVFNNQNGGAVIDWVPPATGCAVESWNINEIFPGPVSDTLETSWPGGSAYPLGAVVFGQNRIFEVTGIVDGNPGASYEFTVMMPDVVSPTKPATVVRPVLRGSQSLSVIWGLSTDAAADISSYQVQYRRAGTNTYLTRTVTAPSRTLSLYGLRSGTTYLFRVRAIDDYGNIGPYTSLSAIATR